MDLMLTDKVAVVTAASKGIGLAVTRALSDEGAFVVAGARNPASLDGIENVTAVAAISLIPRVRASLWSARSTSMAGSTCWSTTCGAVKLRVDGFLALNDDDFS